MYIVHEGVAPLSGPPRKNPAGSVIATVKQLLETILIGLRIGVLAKAIVLAA